MSTEDQGPFELIKALLSGGLLNIGPVERGVMFPMHRLVWWDTRRDAIEIVLAAGDSTETIHIDAEMSADFRHDLRKLRKMNVEAIEKKIQEQYLHDVPVDGSKQ